MDARTQKEIDKILVKFLGEIARWNQANAAKLLCIDRRRFNDYYNHRCNPPEVLLIQMERFLHSRGIYLEKNKPDKFANSDGKLPHSERAKQVLADRKWRERRRGRPKNTEKINCHRDDNLTQKNRTDSKRLWI